MPLTELFGSAPGFDATRRLASRCERLCAALTAGCVVATLLVAVGVRPQVELTPDATFVLASLLWLGQALIAILLVLRARFTGDAGTATLAAGYALAALVEPLVVVTLPEIGLRPNGETAFWASQAMRLGIVVGIGGYALSHPGRSARLGAKLLLAAVLALATVVSVPGGASLGVGLVTATGRFLPPHVVVDALSLTVAVVVAALLLRRVRRPTSLDLWMGIALLTAGGFAIALLVGDSRASGASPAGRLVNVVSTLLVLAALALEVARLFTRGRVLDQFRAIAELSGTIVFLLDRGGSWLYVNRRWTELTGQAAEAALGDGWREQAHAHDVAASTELWTREVAAGRPQRAELRLRTRRGTYRWYLANITPIRAAGRVIGFYGTAMDVDAPRRAHEEVERLYAREQRISRTLQGAFLPPYLPEVPGVQLQAHYRPASREAEVGGDWYDAFLLRDGRLALSIGDVFGHGLDAAGVMIRMRETVRAVTGIVDDDPATILRLANRALASAHPDAIATAALALFDPATGHVVLACAGHPPPVIVSKGRPALLTYGGIPLGVEPEGRFSLAETTLQPGDALVLYTDGLLEGKRDLIAGERRLLEALEAHPDDPDAVVAAVVREPQRDDVAFLRLSVIGPVPMTSWTFVSDDALSAQDARRSFTAHLGRRKADPETVVAAELAFGELVGNVVRHAPGPIEIELAWESETPILTVRDRGPGFSPGVLGLPANPYAEEGRGLYIVATLASPPIVLPRPGGGNEVVVRLSSGALVAAVGAMV